MTTKSKMGLVNGRATGYWGKDIYCRKNSELISDKVLSLNIDKIDAMGLPYAVWREATSVLASPTQCSCFKNTSKQPDIPCLSCYGTGYVPGYLKFGTKNYWASSIDGGWTLSGLQLDTTNRPHRFQLSSTDITGTAISANMVVSETGKIGEWEAHYDAFTRDGGANSTVTVEASVDNGTSWIALTALEDESPITQLRFRVTMTRTTVSVKSPMFEMVRVRFQNVPALRDNLDEPVVLFIPTWDVETEIRQSFGSKMEQEGKNMWTVPLTYFDASLDENTFASRLSDDCIVECRFGGEVGFRYALINFSYSDTFGRFTRQSFQMRRLAGEAGGNDGEQGVRLF
jgi:hypothetical protein